MSKITVIEREPDADELRAHEEIKRELRKEARANALIDMALVVVLVLGAGAVLFWFFSTTAGFWVWLP